ncbi:hypothetical protein [Gynuella sp.]|uniref:hypothetical protein n=1 Tax=Gynuella sp. TaxID=2969146 RepID=UPI003D1330C5
MSQPQLSLLTDTELASQSQNSLYLKQQAVNLVQQVCQQNWTDHNTADPGITLLEVLSFAISDMCYRLEFSVPDLLAPDRARNDWEPEAFFLAPTILPSNLVTHTDIRQAIIDVAGVRNVSIMSANQTPEDGSASFPIASIRLLLELDTPWTAMTNCEQSDLIHRVRQRFMSLRNVNQDLDSILIMDTQPVAVCMSVGLEGVQDPIASLAEIFRICRQVITPDIPKYSLESLQQQGLSGDEIYQGPLTTHGLIQQSDLKDIVLPERLYTSDILDAVKTVEGLKEINGLSFAQVVEKDTGEREAVIQDRRYYWRIDLRDLTGTTDGAQKILTLDLPSSLASLELTLDGQPFSLNEDVRQQIIDRVTSDDSNSTTLSTPVLSDFISQRYRQLRDYVSIQQEFPEIYQLMEQRFDDPKRRFDNAGILQLKGFLTLFDQLLADQMAQLDNLRRLLAIPDTGVYARLTGVFNTMLASETLTSAAINQFWQDVRQLPRTQLSQPITGISGMQQLLTDYFEQYQQQGFQDYVEPILSEWQLNRLVHSLDHLLARFAEKRLDNGLLKYRPVFSHYIDRFNPIPADICRDQPLLDKLVALKSLLDMAAIINDYPRLSQQRAGAANYLSPKPLTAPPAGLLSRIGRFMGWSHIGQIPLAVNSRESIYLLESELLRHGADAESYQPYQLYFVVPDWPSRFANTEFQSLLAEQLRRQSPVHQHVRLISLSRPLMSLFERLYYCWQNAMTQKPLPVTLTSNADSDNDQDQTDDSENQPVNRLSGQLQNALIHKSLRLSLNCDEADSGTCDDPEKLDDENQRISRLSVHLRTFIKAPDSLLEQILSTLVDPTNNNPWQPLIDAIEVWLHTDDKDKINGSNFEEIHDQLAELLSPKAETYGGLDADSLLFALAHERLEQMFNPYPIGQATIGCNFRIGYQPLDYLKPSYPINAAYINPDKPGTPHFTVHISAPNTL